MQNIWLKEPKLIYNKDIIDIVQFGSSIMKSSSPNDVDIGVIFKNLTLKEQLEESQKIKNQLQTFTSLSIHIKSFDLQTFFDKGNFARENILFYGKSLIKKDYFSKLFSLTPKIQISYSLKDMKKKDKIRFNYMLNGKMGQYGLLREYEGRLMAPGLIEISPEFENIFIEKIKTITNNFKVKRVLY